MTAREPSRIPTPTDVWFATLSRAILPITAAVLAVATVVAIVLIETADGPGAADTMGTGLVVMLLAGLPWSAFGTGFGAAIGMTVSVAGPVVNIVALLAWYSWLCRNARRRPRPDPPAAQR